MHHHGKGQCCTSSIFGYGLLAVLVGRHDRANPLHVTPTTNGVRPWISHKREIFLLQIYNVRSEMFRCEPYTVDVILKLARSTIGAPGSTRKREQAGSMRSL